jgi:hypothetical protein
MHEQKKKNVTTVRGPQNTFNYNFSYPFIIFINYSGIFKLCHFRFSRFIDVIMHLDIVYIEMHNIIYESSKVKMTYNLDRRE